MIFWHHPAAAVPHWRVLFTRSQVVPPRKFKATNKLDKMVKKLMDEDNDLDFDGALAKGGAEAEHLKLEAGLLSLQSALFASRI